MIKIYLFCELFINYMKVFFCKKDPRCETNRQTEMKIITLFIRVYSILISVYYFVIL